LTNFLDENMSRIKIISALELTCEMKNKIIIIFMIEFFLLLFCEVWCVGGYSDGLFSNLLYFAVLFEN